MKIALVHNLSTGGGKRHLFEQARELASRGHELTLFAPRSAVFGENLPVASLCRETHLYGPEQDAVSVGVATGKGGRGRRALIEKAKCLPLARELLDTLWSRRTESAMSALSRLYREMAWDIERGGFDLVYVHHCVLTLAPDLLQLVRTTPTVFCCHDTQRSAMEWPVEGDPGYDTMPETWLRRRYRGRILGIAQRRFARRLEERFVANTRAATMVLANSDYSREALARGAGVNAQVCYPGVDTDFFSPDLEKGTLREQTILSVGALLPTKRHEFILESVARIPLPCRPRLEIIGYVGGPQSAVLEQRLQERARETSVELTIRKHVGETELREAYRRASVVAFAPYLEPFGLAAIEAMACGTPVVGVREGGVRETVTHGETGLLTGLDHEQFAASLTSLLGDIERRARLGRQARLDVDRRWTWKHSTDTLEMLLVAAVQGQNKTMGRNPNGR